MKFSTKLFFANFIIGIVFLSILSFTIYKLGHSSVIKSQFIFTEAIAKEVAEDINRLLYEKMKIALTLAKTPVIKKALETSNLFYAKLPDKKRKESIKRLNEKWKSTRDPADSFILEVTDNDLSQFFKNQQATIKGEYGEIFLTNKFGALVASNSKLSTFAHGHKYWWRESYNNGDGTVFFDDRGYDDSVGGYVLGIVVPIRDGTEIIGILKCKLNVLGSISQLILGKKHPLIGTFKLIRSGGRVVFEEGREPLSTQLPDFVLKKLESKNRRPLIVNDSGEKYLVGVSKVGLTNGEEGYAFGGTFESIDHKKGNTGELWYVGCFRRMSIITASFVETIKSAILSGIVIIFILAWVSYLFGRKIAEPLVMLNKATEKIGEGDFEYRIDRMKNDEFGRLAHSFNSMSSRLQKSTTSLALLENEIVRGKQIEASLRESENRYRELFDNMRSGVAVYEAVDNGDDFVFVDFNHPGERMENRNKQDVIGRRVTEVFPGVIEFGLHQVFKRVWKTGKSESHPLSMYRDGNLVEWRENFVYKLPTGEIVAVFTDETMRVKTEEALRRSEKQALAALEAARGLFFSYNIVSGKIELGGAIEKILGFTPAEFAEVDIEGWAERIHPSDRDEILSTLEESAQGDRTSVEYRFRTKHGDYIVLSSIYLAERDGKGLPVRLVGIMQDITETKELYEEAVRVGHLASLGELAAGVAHEINNPINGIIGYAEILQDEFNDRGKDDDIPERIIKEGDRIAKIVGNLLAFARDPEEEHSPAHIQDILADALSLVENQLLKDGIKLNLNVSPDLPKIKVRNQEIQQVFLNIISNARYALNQRFPESHKDKILEIRGEILEIEGAKRIRMTFHDRGTGISDEITDKIRDPFYSTKPKNEGTGLGLSISHGIIEKHKGTLRFESVEGEYTKVMIEFPLDNGWEL